MARTLLTDDVREVFDGILARPGELGASFVAYLDGERIVDLHGGWADPARIRPWTAETAALVYSGTKGITALCLLRLWDAGLLDDDAPIARYWPQFAAAGKEGVLVRHLLSHTTGLPGLRRAYSFDELLDTDGFAALVAAEPLFTPPGAMLCYHAKTFGTMAAQLVRRIDGRSIGAFFTEEFAEPLGLDVWFGRRPPEGRVAVLERILSAAPEIDLSAFTDDERAALAINVYDPPDPDGGVTWNRPDAIGAEVASTSAITTADGMATLYRVLAEGGVVDGRRFLSEAAVQRAMATMARTPILGTPGVAAFGAGFQHETWMAPRSAPEVRGVGHGGAGGSNHGAWPHLRTSFSFTMNTLRGVGDDRAPLLLDALHELVLQKGDRR